MNNYLEIFLSIIFGTWIILTISLWNSHKNDKVVIASYAQEIATLKSDATARAARDKVAAEKATQDVKDSNKKADDVLEQQVPENCEDVRAWAVKQSQSI